MAYEPSTSDDISPDLRRAFRRGLLQYIAVHGAHTEDELRQTPPAILHLRLEPDEIEAALDLSRRRGEVEFTPDDEIGKGEWRLTDLGRPHARQLTSRAVARASSVLATVVALIGVAEALGENVSLHVGWEKWIAIGVTAIFVAEVTWLVLMDYRYGISRRKIAYQWKRYRSKRPHGFAFYRKRLLMIITVVVFVSAFVVCISVLDDEALWAAMTFLLTSIIVVHLWFLVRFRKARSEWKSSEANERERQVPGRAPEPSVAS